MAVLRVDPTVASLAFSVVEGSDDEHTAIFANGRGLLTYWVPRDRDLVVLLRLIWRG